MLVQRMYDKLVGETYRDPCQSEPGAPPILMVLVFTLVLSPDPLELPDPADPPEPPEFEPPVLAGSEFTVDDFREEPDVLVGVGIVSMEQ